jgi:phosphate uptake regulator
MEYRKLIKFGNSSYVISLPKTWMQKNNLNKGDLVYFAENGNNELVLTPNNVKGQRVKLQETTVNIDGKSFNDIKRELVSAYIRNVHQITIEGKNLDKKVREIREYMSNLMALEIVDQNRNKIVAKDFLNMKKISLYQTIKKVDNIVRGMMTDAKMMFETDSYHSIMVRDEDVNKLTNMMLRVGRYALRKPHLIQNTGLAPFDFFRYIQVADKLEMIADGVKRASRYMRNTECDECSKKELLVVFNEICQAYEEVMEAFYANDVEKALKCASKDNGIRERCDAVAVKCNAKHISIITEKLKHMNYNIHSIGREVYQ